jgi:PaaX-like protein
VLQFLVVKRVKSHKELPNSALRYILEALIPYSEANLKLAFKPNQFFNDLENIEKQKAWQSERQHDTKIYPRNTLRNAFYKAKKNGLVTVDHDGNPRLTEKGRQQIKPYQAVKLDKSARLMVIDVPENERVKRRHLRTLLKELDFEMVQQSVWISSYDHRALLKSEIKEYGLQKYVRVFECAQII